jgi:hypothetical protein
MSDKKNVEMVFQDANAGEISIDSKAVAELLRLALCRGDLRFLGVRSVEDKEVPNAGAY